MEYMNGLDIRAHDLLSTRMLCQHESLGPWVTGADSRVLHQQGSLKMKLYILPIFSAAWEWEHLIKHLLSDMNDLLDPVGHNPLTVLPTYLFWKKMLPEKALQVHLMNTAVSVTDCGICFNKLWGRFSDQWALTFQEGKTNFTAPDVTVIFPSWLWPCSHGNFEICWILLALEVINFLFSAHRPRLLFSFRDLMLETFLLRCFSLYLIFLSCVHGAHVVYMFVCGHVCLCLSVAHMHSLFLTGICFILFWRKIHG